MGHSCETFLKGEKLWRSVDRAEEPAVQLWSTNNGDDNFTNCRLFCGVPSLVKGHEFRGDGCMAFNL